MLVTYTLLVKKTDSYSEFHLSSRIGRIDGLAFPSVSVPLAAASLVICCQHLFHASGAQEVLPCEGYGVTVSQLDLPSLTPLLVAGCGRLHLEAADWATSVALLQVVNN